MPSKTVTLNVGAAFDGPLMPLADCRRLVRTIGAGVAQSLGAVITVGLLITSVTLGAAWIANSALVTGPQTAVRSFNGPRTLALVTDAPVLSKTGGTTFDSKWQHASVGSLPLMPQGVMMADGAPAAMVPLPPKRVAERAARVPLPHERPPMPPVEVAQVPAKAPAPVPVQVLAQAPAEPVGPQTPPQVVAKAAPQVAMVMPPANDKRGALPPQDAAKEMPKAPGDIDGRTAVYDISARAVFLPSGEKLEAHSGLYDKMDDPRYVHVRMRGPTPPNVYDLTLREQIFHGVRAIRLNPVDERKMFGRDGMLAHTYMLGPNGQSNGCVSFKDYDRFLQAFLRGEIDRLVVVPRGGTQLAQAAHERRGKAGRYAANDARPQRSAGLW